MRVLIFILFLGFAVSGHAQSIVKGVVKDMSSGESLPMASVQYAEGKGTVTDLDGNFTLSIPPGKYTLKISYVGMTDIVKEIVAGPEPLILDFKMETSTMSEVTIVSDIAVGRRTPVAFSDISSIKIKEELGTRDLPLVLNSTPGVYATSAGGGDGDARINVRGFNQRYVAVMVDGIPMNDMENGWVYWSNWFGLDVVTQKVQVQRGLGASKLAIPSVGGTINVLSQGIDQKQKITISSEYGNNQNIRETIGYNSGRLKGGFGITAAISAKKNNGWVDNLRSEQLFYFLKIQKEFQNQSISLSIMGSPQQHYQRPLRMPVEFYDRDYARSLGINVDESSEGNFGVNHNQHWGYLTRTRVGDTPKTDFVSDKFFNRLSGRSREFGDRELLSERKNYYHKPIVNFKHFISLGERLAISNIIYASFGEGGGTRLSSALTNSEGNTDFDQLYRLNTRPIVLPFITNYPYDLSYVNDTSQYKSKSYIFSQLNNHFWAGALSSFKFQVNKRLDLSGGFDGRYYYTDRYQVMYDLLGGDYAVPNAGGDDQNNPQNKVVREGDIFGYKLRTFVKQGGLFFLAEYHKDKLTAFVNVTGSINAYNRTDYFARKTAEGDYRTSGWKTFPGGTIKTGASYNFDKKNSVFVNAGFLSRAQMVTTVFVGRSLEEYQNIENEKIIAQELGYAYNDESWHVAVNVYNTIWQNKPVVQSIPFGTEVYQVSVPGMDALHRGIETEAEYIISPKLTAEVAVTLSDWRWLSDGEAIITDEIGTEIGTLKFGAKNVKVGDAAQSAFSAGIRFEPIKRLYIKPRITYFDRYYADFDPESLQGDNAGKQSWQIPAYYQLDINMGYSHPIGEKKYMLGFRVNLLNVTNVVYISDARVNDYGTTFDAQSAGVFMGMGFRWNTGINFTF